MKSVASDIIVEKEGKILLIKRGRSVFIGKLAFPGGKVNDGESAEEAAVREMKEETNLGIELTDILGVYSHPKRDPRNEVVSVCFIAKITGGELKASDDAADAKWCSLEEIKEEDMAFDHFKIIQDYLKWRKEKRTYWSSKM